MSSRRWRAYDLPHPDPVAENLTYEEMLRFKELEFWVEEELVSSDVHSDPEIQANIRARRIYERRVRLNQRSGRNRVERRKRQEQAA